MCERKRSEITKRIDDEDTTTTLYIMTMMTPTLENENLVQWNYSTSTGKKTTPSGIATSRTKYASAQSIENEQGSFGKSVPCVSLRSRFAAEFNSRTKSPRSPLGELKLNSQENTPKQTLKRHNRTPTTQTKENVATPSKSKEETLHKTLDWVKECAMWTNPARSCLAFSSGFLTLLTWHYTNTGVIHFRPFSSLSYCGLIMLAVNFFGSIFFKNYTPRPVFSQQGVQSVAKQIEDVVLSSTPAINRAFSGRDAAVTLQLAFSMWTMITLNKMMPFSLICLIGYCALFTIPLVYKNFECEIARHIALGKKLGMNVWNSVNMDRKYKLTTVGGILGMLWLVCAIHTKITSLFVAVIVFKCFLNPAEVEKITNVAAPMTQKVKKKAKRLSMGMRDAMGLGQLVSPKSN